jgi:elongation factor G
MSGHPARHRPILSVAVTPRTVDERKKLEQALSVLVAGDPALCVEPESGGDRTILSGISEAHLQQTCERIADEYNILLETDSAKVIYLETIRKEAEGEGKYIRQSGSQGNYGHCRIRMEPNPRGSGYEFISAIQSGAIPDKFIASIKRGIRDALKCGVLYGCRLVDVKVTLYDGSFHETDSNEMAFQFAGTLAAKQAARKASPMLLEPMMAVEITIPEEHIGAVIRDINARRGRIERVDQTQEMQQQGQGMRQIAAIAPLAELLGYAKEIQLKSRGRAQLSIEFARYESTPHRGDPNAGTAGVTANKPAGPKAGSRSAEANFDQGLR